MVSHPHVFTPTRPTGCQGFAASTKKQCGQFIGRFCRYHTRQANACRAIKRDGLRCTKRIDGGEGRSYFCDSHCDWATLDEAVCQGFKCDNGERVRCYRRVTYEDYQFCMPQHDDRVEYNDPRKLRPLSHSILQPDDGLDGQDPYNPGRYLQRNDHIDHISELQITASVLSFVTFWHAEDKSEVIEFARDDLLNKSFNLCQTQPETNLKKGSAVSSFLGDAMVHSIKSYNRADQRALTEIRDRPIIETFHSRLREEGLRRDSTRAITREMERALKTIVTTFSDQGETPIFNDVAYVTLKMAHAMGLSTDLDLRLD